MDCEVPPGRSQPRRPPLRDASNRSNIPSSGPRQSTQGPSSSSLGKSMRSSERVNPGESPDPQIEPVENRRVSAVAEGQPNSKRNSTISTTSTASGKSRRKTHIGPWQLGRTLGKGSTGRVRLAKHSVTGKHAAIKIVSKKSAKMVQSQSIAAMDRNNDQGWSTPRVMPCAVEREVVIMKLINHPNVISLYDVWENRGELYLVLEHVEGGELFDYVSTKGALPEIEAVLFFRQIIGALASCHRFNICHRDLKPENILIDQNGNIKLADFGMAALQPEGHWLNTSCGSPHYASPEIIYGRRYKGDRADIWSCGIILFAMLTGFLPFDGGDLQSTLKLVKKGEYILPHWLTLEAADLIQRILQMRPEDRITISEILTHPLLVKYEKHPRFAEAIRIDFASLPTANDRLQVVLRRQDIDMEIVRSLRTLWHEATLDQLIANLMNSEPNQEKFFYETLLKFRDEKLEKSQDGQPLEYSSSDHHHMSRPVMSIAQRRLQSNGADPRFEVGAKLSISIGAPCGKENGPYDEPKSARTAASYDPYRSSHTPLHEPNVGFANVTIHRQSSNLSNKPDVQSPSGNTFTGDALPSSAQNLQQPDSCKTAPCSGSFRRSSLVSFQSRTSIGSIPRQRLRSSSTPRSISYKRNVSFRHLRSRTSSNPVQRNGVTRARSQYSLCPDSSEARLHVKKVNRLSSSPSLPTPPPPVRTRKDDGNGAELNIAKPRLSYHHWKEDARKVSAELGQICEEAFNRSSVSSSSPTTEHSNRDSSGSPPTSVSTEEKSANTANDFDFRALEDKPVESSTSYATRELAETRRRLIEHSNTASAEGMPEYLSDVISHLDRLLATEASSYAHSNAGNLATSSIPTTRPRRPCLPSISEEGDAIPNNIVSRDMQSKSAAPDGENTRRNTIRLVTPEPPPKLDIIKPLTVRKRTNVLPTLPEHPTDFLSGTLFEDNSSDDVNLSSPTSRRGSRYYSALDPIEEDPKSPRSSEVRSSGETRKWSWFKHFSQWEDDDTPPTPPLKDNVTTQRATVSTSRGGTDKQLQPTDPENQNKAKGRDRSSRLMRIFGKKKVYEGKPAHELARGINDPDETMASIASATPSDITGGNGHTGGMDESTSRRHGGQNWFARFFHIKPVTKVMALNISKARARKEVMKILREWKKYGMEGVRLDKEKGVIKARVGELNFLRLRPVEFSAEFYTVLEYGRHVNLSLMKLKQEQGAASSFNKVVETLTVVMKQRNFLIEDSARAKKMCKVLDLGH